jgi:hypothetical protein
MEIAIPLVALGGMYVISNQNKNDVKNDVKKGKKENFNNMGIRTNLGTRNTESPLSNYLPNTNISPQNYPIMNNKELVDFITSLFVKSTGFWTRKSKKAFRYFLKEVSVFVSK